MLTSELKGIALYIKSHKNEKKNSHDVNQGTWEYV